jgi:hypothetical protein
MGIRFPQNAPGIGVYLIISQNLFQIMNVLKTACKLRNGFCTGGWDAFEGRIDAIRDGRKKKDSEENGHPPHLAYKPSGDSRTREARRRAGVSFQVK